ncbi:MAG: 50S ribosomal protein L13 [Candidatus Omnitrophica bacterium]|nr:50S ribosomal protein L13 [Candidatus Omnitrophota bacterium]
MVVQKTTLPKKDKLVKCFYVVNAEGKTLGRLASRVALVLRGKHKPTFTPHMDTGDHVIIINADKIHVTGKKTTDKAYDRYSGFHSGLKSIPYKKMMDRRPTQALKLAINRMIPKGKLGDVLKAKLFIYAGAEHPHQAQKPVVLEF